MTQLKPIRFNMQFNYDGQIVPIRSMEDLKTKMNINDLYEYFSEGILARWLDVHGEKEKAQQIQNLEKDKDKRKTLEKIFKILGFDDKKERISEAISSYLFDEIVQRKKMETEARLNRINEAILLEIDAYRNLKKMIIQDKEDFSKVKTATWTLLEKYADLFSLDYMDFYDVMARDCPLAVFAALMHETGRKFFLPPKDEKDLENCLPSEKTFRQRLKDFTTWKYDSSRKYVFCVNGSKIEGSYLFRNDADHDPQKSVIKEPDYESGKDGWQDVVSKGHRVMILHCGDKIEIRPPKDNNNQRKGQEVSPYEIMNGFDFRVLDPTSFDINRRDYILLYMEID